MQKIKLQPKTFIALSLMAVALILPIYFLVIDLWLVASNAKIPGSYKELLLTKTTGKKIIIDSGSNSYFGIDTIMLGRYFRMPAINMADNAEYPVRHKFNYLVRYANEGDIILLPLEWQQYTHSDLYDHYVTHVLQGELSYYYKSMPLIERMHFVFNSVRINFFLSAVLKRLSNPSERKWATKKLKDFNTRLQMNKNTSFGSVLRDPDMEQSADNAGPGGCDQYIFKKQLQHGFYVGDEFKEALNILGKAAEKGVTIVFTWPAVVDREGDEACYSNPYVAKMKEFSASIRNLIQGHGFMFIGTPEQSHFPDNYYYDTFFHLNEDGSKIRTRRLIQLMESSGIEADTGDHSPEQTIQQLTNLIGDLQRQYGEE